MRKLKYISPFPLFGQRCRLGRKQGCVYVKLTVIMLTFLFIMGPIWPVWGQEEIIESVVVEQVAPTPNESEQTASTDGTVEENPALMEKIIETEEQAVPEESATDSQLVQESGAQLDAGGDTINQQSSVQKSQVQLPQTDESTGALVYRYSIEVPPGRNGLQPSLELTYNSQQQEGG